MVKHGGSGRCWPTMPLYRGGYPGLIAGGLAGFAISIAVHFLVDATNKFGLAEPAGPVLDQVAHGLTIFLIWWMFQPTLIEIINW